MFITYAYGKVTHPRKIQDGYTISLRVIQEIREIEPGKKTATFIRYNVLAEDAQPKGIRFAKRIHELHTESSGKVFVGLKVTGDCPTSDNGTHLQAKFLDLTSIYVRKKLLWSNNGEVPVIKGLETRGTGLLEMENPQTCGGMTILSMISGASHFQSMIESHQVKKFRDQSVRFTLTNHQPSLSGLGSFIQCNCNIKINREPDSKGMLN